MQGPDAASAAMPARLPANSIRHAGPVNSLNVGIDFGTARSGYAFAYGTDNTPQLQVGPRARLLLQQQALETLSPCRL